MVLVKQQVNQCYSTRPPCHQQCSRKLNWKNVLVGRMHTQRPTTISTLMLVGTAPSWACQPRIGSPKRTKVVTSAGNCVFHLEAVRSLVKRLVSPDVTFLFVSAGYTG